MLEQPLFPILVELHSWTGECHAAHQRENYASPMAQTVKPHLLKNSF